MPELSTLALLFFSGILAGISNAIAGGGTFFTFPVFLAAGVPPVIANASNAVAVWPGHALAVIGYREELRAFSGGIRTSIFIAILGGAVGALLLTYIGNKSFMKLIPFLILFATILFAFGGVLSRRVNSKSSGRSFASPSLVTQLCEFSFAVYGGFFGAGMGIMLMAGLHMLGVHDIQVNNALKNFLAAVVTSIAVCIFAFSGLVAWPYTLLAFSGAVIGGLAGAYIARWLSAIWLRRIVISLGLFLSIYYFIKYYG